ncbi:hypothetical protein SLA2020_390490 [Shorea laevis]
MKEIAEENGHTAVDLRGPLASYKDLVKMDYLIRTGKPCIFKIPKTLRRHNRTAYRPNAFSFGPLHYDKRGLKAAQAIKFRFLEETLLHGGHYDLGTKLAEAERAIYEKLEEARQCYAKKVKLKDELFVKILVLDGCFIINLFFLHYLDKKIQAF